MCATIYACVAVDVSVAVAVAVAVGVVAACAVLKIFQVALGRLVGRNGRAAVRLFLVSFGLSVRRICICICISSISLSVSVLVSVSVSAAVGCICICVCIQVRSQRLFGSFGDIYQMLLIYIELSLYCYTVYNRHSATQLP